MYNADICLRTVKAPVKCTAIKNNEKWVQSLEETKGAMIWKELEIGTSEKKGDTRTIQYPVTSRWAKELDNPSGDQVHIYTHQCSAQVAVDEKSI